MSDELTFCKLCRFLGGATFHAIVLAFGRKNSATMRDAFLRPTAEVLSTVPCTAYSEERCGRYCPRSILYMEEQHCVLSYCPRFLAPDETLKDEDLNVFQPNLPQLFWRVADALKIRPGVEASGVDGVWRIGEFSPSASRKYPVFFIAHTLSQGIQVAVRQLLLEYAAGPMIVFCVNDTPLDGRLMRSLQTRRALFINADSCLTISFGGEVGLKVESKSIFAPLTEMGDVPADSSFGYDFPAGCSWEDLLVHCQADPEKVAFQIAGATSVHTRIEMKIGKTQWSLLRAFAEKFGRLPSAGILQNDALKKQRERLNRGLKEYFRTSEDAIVLSSDQSEYVCRFKLKPSWHSTIHHVKKRT